MFGPVGVAYVYFVYGNHWMLNVVAHDSETVGAVLIRAARPVLGLEEMRSRRRSASERELMNGPGKLCQAFGIDGGLTGTDLVSTGILVLGPEVEDIWSGPRVGLAEGRGEHLPWRFIDRGETGWASRPRPS